MMTIASSLCVFSTMTRAGLCSGPPVNTIKCEYRTRAKVWSPAYREATGPSVGTTITDASSHGPGPMGRSGATLFWKRYVLYVCQRWGYACVNLKKKKTAQVVFDPKMRRKNLFYFVFNYYIF